MTAPQSSPQPSGSPSASQPSATTPNQPTRPPTEQQPDRVLPLLRGAVPPTLVVGALTVLGAALLGGGRGALGALLGVLVVVLFSGTGLLALRLVRTSDPMLVMVVALGSYLLRIVLFGAAIALTSTVPGIDEALNRTATAVAVMVCVAAWLAGEIRAYTRLRIPTYEVELPTTDADGAGGAGRADGAERGAIE